MSDLGALRSRLGNLVRYRQPGDPDIDAARRDLVAETLAIHVERSLTSAPPLTRAQRARIVALLDSRGRSLTNLN